MWSKKEEPKKEETYSYYYWNPNLSRSTDITQDRRKWKNPRELVVTLALARRVYEYDGGRTFVVMVSDSKSYWKYRYGLEKGEVKVELLGYID